MHYQSSHRVRSFTPSLVLMAIALSLACEPSHAQSPEASDWGSYGGDVFGRRYSEVDQINRSNVSRLKPVWTYRTGELGKGLTRARKLAFEATPVLAFDLLYVSTPTNIVIALEPATGKPRWRYDPKIDRTANYSEVASRGVTVWQDPDFTRSGVCSRKVFIGTLDARLIALDAYTGRPCADFGTQGTVDLTKDIRVRGRGNYQVSSPPAVLRDVVIVGSSIGDNRATDLERGALRAFDARTGQPRWSFDTIPDSPDHPAAKEWRPEQARNTGAANAWSVMSVDPERGLVFVPTGSASPDFYGGKRLGSNRFANSLLAIDASTGKLVWHQQLIHHDLWDYDLAAQPTLAQFDVRGRSYYAVLQATKSGSLFVFERDTGMPILPVAERPVPKSLIRGESAWPTQPYPNTPPLVSHAPVEESDAWGVTFWDRGRCRKLIAKYRSEGLFTPPSTQGTILYPSYAGGVNWGSLAVDDRRMRVFATVNHLPAVVTLVTRAEAAKQRASGNYPDSEFAEQKGAPYAMRRELLLSPFGLPCTPPPWGTLVSVDLRRNRIAWQVPLGTTEGFGPSFLPARNFGLPLMGGPIATAGDLVFVGAAMDSYIRAFDAETGRELWKHHLPAGGQATPMTYRSGKDQRQFVVIAAGGHGALGTPQGDYVVAFALPSTKQGE